MTSQRTSALSEARFRIAGFGSALPSGILTNRDLGDRFGVDGNWIESRCGIQTRHVAEPRESTHSLAVIAARSPEVSSTAFRTQPPNLQPAPLMDTGFVVICQLARRRMPLIRFSYIGSHVCSTLL